MEAGQQLSMMVSNDNNNHPLVSIVVPAYNVELYLDRCLNSILNQKYPEVEIIVVDDGAIDHSGDIADQYAQKYPDRIISIRTDNHGVTSARLTGVEQASGEWIGFVDGDDQIEPDMYQRLVANALKYHADISHCGYRTVVNNGERVHWFYNTGRFVQQDRITGLKDLLSGAFIEPSLCNKLFHKTLFHSLLHTELMDKSICINEDLLMNYYLFNEAVHSIYEDFCPYIYMARTTSVTRAGVGIDRQFDAIKVRKIIMDSICPELKDLAWNKLFIVSYGLFGTAYNDPQYRSEAMEIKRFIVQNWKKWRVLSSKELIRLLVQVYAPNCFRLVYGVYVMYFQKKVYE